jgi:hypothetical protein
MTLQVPSACNFSNDNRQVACDGHLMRLNELQLSAIHDIPNNHCTLLKNGDLDANTDQGAPPDPKTPGENAKFGMPTDPHSLSFFTNDPPRPDFFSANRRPGSHQRHPTSPWSKSSLSLPAPSFFQTEDFTPSATDINFSGPSVFGGLHWQLLVYGQDLFRGVKLPDHDAIWHNAL